MKTGMLDEADESNIWSMAQKAWQQDVWHILGTLLMKKTSGQPLWKGYGPTMYIYTHSLSWILEIEGDRKMTEKLGPPATDPGMSYREEGPNLMANRSANEDVISNLNRWMSSDSATLKTQDRNLVIATWNVRALYQAGKLDNAIQEMKMKIDILRIAETRWTESGKISKDSHTILYSGGQEHRNGVGILMKNNIARSIMGYWPISNRVIMVKLQGKSFNINS